MGNPAKSFLLIAVACIAIGAAAVTGYLMGQDGQSGVARGLSDLSLGMRKLGEGIRSGQVRASVMSKDGAPLAPGRYALYQTDAESPVFLLDTATGTARILDPATGEWLWTTSNTKRHFGEEAPSTD